MKTAPLYRTLKIWSISVLVLLNACTGAKQLASSKAYDDAYYTTTHTEKENKPAPKEPTQNTAINTPEVTPPTDYTEEGYVVSDNAYYNPNYTQQPNFGQGWNTSWGNGQPDWNRYHSAYNQYPCPTSQWGNNMGWNTSIGWNNSWNNPYNNPYNYNDWNNNRGWTYTSTWNNQTGWTSGWSYNWGWNNNHWNNGWGNNGWGNNNWNSWNNGWGNNNWNGWNNGWGRNNRNNGSYTTNPITVARPNTYRGPRYNTGGSNTISPTNSGQVRMREEEGRRATNTPTNITVRTREDVNRTNTPVEINRERTPPTPNNTPTEPTPRERTRPTPNNNRFENPDRPRTEPTPRERTRTEPAPRERERPTPNNNCFENPDRPRTEPTPRERPRTETPRQNTPSTPRTRTRE